MTLNALCDERDRIVKAGMPDEDSASRYPEQRANLVEMIKEKLSENGISFADGVE